MRERRQTLEPSCCLEQEVWEKAMLINGAQEQKESSSPLIQKYCFSPKMQANYHALAPLSLSHLGGSGGPSGTQCWEFAASVGQKGRQPTTAGLAAAVTWQRSPGHPWVLLPTAHHPHTSKAKRPKCCLLQGPGRKKHYKPCHPDLN